MITLRVLPSAAAYGFFLYGPFLTVCNSIRPPREVFLFCTALGAKLETGFGPLHSPLSVEDGLCFPFQDGAAVSVNLEFVLHALVDNVALRKQLTVVPVEL